MLTTALVAWNFAGQPLGLYDYYKDPSQSAALDPHHSSSSDARVTQVALPSYSVVGRWSLGLTTQIGDHLSHHGESDAVSPLDGEEREEGREEGRARGIGEGGRE